MSTPTGDIADVNSIYNALWQILPEGHQLNLTEMLDCVKRGLEEPLFAKSESTLLQAMAYEFQGQAVYYRINTKAQQMRLHHLLGDVALSLSYWLLHNEHAAFAAMEEAVSWLEEYLRPQRPAKRADQIVTREMLRAYARAASIAFWR